MTKHKVCRWWVAAAIAFGSVAPAHAEGPSVEVLMQVKAPDKNNPKTKDDAPQIEVTVIGAPNLPSEKFSLHDDTSKQPIEIKPTSKRDYNQGSETLAVALVMNGGEYWIGNDDYRQAGDALYCPGVLKSLESALDKLSFKDAGPNGSVGMVITYADKIVTKVPMGPLGNISGGVLGSQTDYKETQGLELVKGIETAMSELHRVQAARKALIIVGDGKDTNPEAAKGQLALLKKQATQEGIQTFAIIYKGGLALQEENPVVINAMVPGASTVNSADSIASSIQSILARMADRQYLTFAGYDPKTEAGLVWDGKVHNLVLKIDKDDTEPVALTLAPIWSLSKGGFPWLVILLVVVGAIALIAIGVKVFGAKPAPMPMPIAAPVVAAEAPKPSAPAKTIMITSDGGDGGFPIVGWIVPLNGAQAYQTFRLQPGATKIGTAFPAQIVINDGFMSTEHCQITTSPQGFILVDGGSTNGCYVNDRKVQGKQDLVDNDTFTLGKTSFKFKSIN